MVRPSKPSSSRSNASSARARTGSPAGRSGQCGQREVAGHDHSRARVDRRRKRDELAIRQLCTRARTTGSTWCGSTWCRRGRGSAWRSRRRPRFAGRAPLPRPACPRHLDRRRSCGCPARGCRLRGEVAHRRVVDVDAQRPQLAPGRRGHSLGQLSSPAAPSAIAPRELRRSAAQRVELAAFLVGGNQQRSARQRRRAACKGRRQRADLWRDRRHCESLKSVTPAYGRDCTSCRLAAGAGSVAAGEGDHQTPVGHT